jgi:hypothetical protein
VKNYAPCCKAGRGWGVSRVCRDYYDLWWILSVEGGMGGQIPDLLERKCQVRQVTLNSPDHVSRLRKFYAKPPGQINTDVGDHDCIYGALNLSQEYHPAVNNDN